MATSFVSTFLTCLYHSYSPRRTRSLNLFVLSNCSSFLLPCFNYYFNSLCSKYEEYLRVSLRINSSISYTRHNLRHAVLNLVRFSSSVQLTCLFAPRFPILCPPRRLYVPQWRLPGLPRLPILSTCSGNLDTSLLPMTFDGYHLFTSSTELPSDSLFLT